MRDPAQPGAGKLRERVRFLRGSLDANGDPEGPELVELFSVRAQIEAAGGPTRNDAERSEGQQSISLTIRSTARTRALSSGLFVRWLRFPHRLYRLGAPTEDARRMFVTANADAWAAGTGG